MQRERAGQEPCVVLRVEQESVQHAGRESPTEPGFQRARIRVRGEEQHGHHRRVEAREVRVEEHARHEGKRERRYETWHPTELPAPPSISDRHAERTDGHTGEAIRRALFAKYSKIFE